MQPSPLLDRNHNVAILTAGIVSLILGIGVARVAFTSLLPPMLEAFLDVTTRASSRPSISPGTSAGRFLPCLSRISIPKSAISGSACFSLS